MTNFEKVGRFHQVFGHPVNTAPALVSDKAAELRLDLIREELQELEYAVHTDNIIEIADALTDILYVTYGAAHAYGIDVDACFDEVQRSNMSKAGEDGEPIYREDGKILKGPNYSEPNLKPILFGEV